jgi:hypothetical protein
MTLAILTLRQAFWRLPRAECERLNGDEDR